MNFRDHFVSERNFTAASVEGCDPKNAGYLKIGF